MKISDRLTKPGIEWCTARNVCKLNGKNDVYYNTPISMADDITKHSFPDNTISFIYLDYTKYSTEITRIRKNIKNRKNVVILTNGNVVTFGHYQIEVDNCDINVLAQYIALIIGYFRKHGRLVHPNDLKRCMLPKKSDDMETITPTTDEMRCNLFDFMDHRRRMTPEDDDCTLCTI